MRPGRSTQTQAERLLRGFAWCNDQAEAVYSHRDLPQFAERLPGVPHGPQPQAEEAMSKRTNSVNPSYPSGKRFQATNITARGNVVVYELTNARTDAKGNLVLYDGPHGGTLWVEADKVGSTPEEAVRVALNRTRAKVTGTKKLLKVFETDRDALVNVLSPYTGKTYPRRGKIVLKSTKVQPPKDQPPKVRA